MFKVYHKKVDLENLDLKKVYTFEEFTYINDQLKTRTIEIDEEPITLFEFDNGKLIPMPQVPYAIEKVVSKISFQLEYWNMSTNQNGGVTTSQGGFNFYIGGKRTIRAPDISYTPNETDLQLNQLQNWTFKGCPFTPIFLVEVANIKKESDFENYNDRFRYEFLRPETSVRLCFLIDIGPEKRKIYSWRKYQNNIVRQYEHEWKDLDTKISDQEVLPGFILNVNLIDKALLQRQSDLSSEDKDNIGCPKCNATFTNDHNFLKHYLNVHAYK
ncbi:hypothetical protein Glove_116g30 [Diversispora epigaea]|uniref:C2H2-type domain-containing protein n=1 Tax=Diversispora epigaea TaxID=1348612 RepID=A0A397J7D0_9GLOM|nr:hypothetical protein Glove_116g30 [Diversispora epigaea]